MAADDTFSVGVALPDDGMIQDWGENVRRSLAVNQALVVDLMDAVSDDGVATGDYQRAEMRSAASEICAAFGVTERMAVAAGLLLGTQIFGMGELSETEVEELIRGLCMALVTPASTR